MTQVHNLLRKGLRTTAAVLALSATTAGAQNMEFFKNNYTAKGSGAFSVDRGWDNNMYAAGTVILGSGTSAHADVLLIKTKPNGDTLWTRSWGMPGVDEQALRVITPSSDEIILVGPTKNLAQPETGNAFMVCFGPTGNLLWSKSYDEPGKRTQALDVKRISGGYMVCGTITDSSTGDVDAWLMQTNTSGVKVWAQQYGGDNYDDAWQLERTGDGGFLLAGGSYSERTGTTYDDAWLVKTDGQGLEQWTRHYGGADTADWIWSITPVHDPANPTGFIFTGVKNRSGSGNEAEMFLSRVDNDGNVVWDKHMAGPFGYLEGLAVELTYDHTFYLAATERDSIGNGTLLAMEIDSLGNIRNTLRYNATAGQGQEWLEPHSIYINNLGDAYIVGVMYLTGVGDRAFMTRIRNIHQQQSGVSEVALPSAVQVYPNPATKVCTVSSAGEQMQRIELRDATGRTLKLIDSPGAYSQELELDGIAPGLYFVTVYTRGISPVNINLLVK